MGVLAFFCIVQNDVKKEKIQDELSKMSKLQKI